MTRRNLFAVDIDGMRRLLAEANAPLVNRSRELLDALERMPAEIAADEDREKAVRFALLLKDQIKECRSARLSDCKSFKEAVKTVESFFAEFEAPLKAAEKTVLAAITRAELRLRAEQSPPPVSTPPPSDVADVVVSDTGTRVVSASPSPLPPPPSGKDSVELVWTVSDVDREAVDLEALRPYFSDHALKQAAQKHLAEKGPNTLGGVYYEQRAKT